MTKASVADWDTTAADNTDINDISLAENVMKPPAVNNALRELMAQVAEMVGGTVSFSAAQSAAFRENIGVDYTFEDIAISGLSSGVLTIPDDGLYFKLTGHGGADFTISGFGTARTTGKVFYLLIPRTIADTGGSANSLGNKVTLAHAASGAGLDLTINRRLAGAASFLYDYEAYPDACNSNGDAINLYELFQFVPLGSGRHELRRLPEPMEFRTANAFVRRSPLGLQEVERRTDLTTGAGSAVTFLFPVLFTNTDYSFASNASSSSTTTAISIHATNLTTTSMDFNSISSAAGGRVATNIRPIVKGFWKT